ncbi:hypothetical protein ACU8DI_13125 [Psychroserpens sp. BH13MA-6]
MSKEGRKINTHTKAEREAVIRRAAIADTSGKKGKIASHPSESRKFSGSVVSVGSPTGRVLLNSSEFDKIMDAIRKVSKGQKTRTIKISVETAKRVISAAK